MLEKAFGKKNIISFSNIDKTEEEKDIGRNSLDNFSIEAE